MVNMEMRETEVNPVRPVCQHGLRVQRKDYIPDCCSPRRLPGGSSTWLSLSSCSHTDLGLVYTKHVCS